MVGFMVPLALILAAIKLVSVSVLDPIVNVLSLSKSKYERETLVGLLILILLLAAVPLNVNVAEPSCTISAVQLVIAKPETDAIVELVSVDVPTCSAVA